MDTDMDTLIMGTVGATHIMDTDILVMDGDTQVTVVDIQDMVTGMVQITHTITAEEAHHTVDHTTITLETILILETG